MKKRKRGRLLALLRAWAYYIEQGFPSGVALTLAKESIKRQETARRRGDTAPR